MRTTVNNFSGSSAIRGNDDETIEDSIGCQLRDRDAQSSQVDRTEAVYREYGSRVYALAMRMLQNESDAEDVTQEVLLQVIRRLDTFRGESTLTTWLYRVTVNASLLLRRKRATAKERQFGETGEESIVRRGVSGRTRGSVDPHEELLDGELRQRLEVAITHLPDAYRDPFVLSDVEGFSNSAICDMLGLSLPAVKSRLHRARLMLRDALQPYFPE